MSAQNNFITIQEAVVFTKKSEKTIRRLVRGLVTENEVTGQVASQDTDKLRVENKNGKHFYSLSGAFLMEQFGLSSQNGGVSGHQENLSGHTTSHEQEAAGHVSGHSENMTGQTTGQEEKTAQPQGLERYVSFLEEQVRVKDEQIKNFQERDKEHNILINRLQEKVLLTEGVRPDYSHEHVIYQPPPKPREEEGIADDLEGAGWSEGETPVTDEGLTATVESATEEEQGGAAAPSGGQGETEGTPATVGTGDIGSVQQAEGVGVADAELTEEIGREEETLAPVAAAPVSGEQGAGEGSGAALPPAKRKGFWRRVFGG